MEKKGLGIYVHIPFCVKKCSYCDFLSMTGDEKTKENYCRALAEEIESYREIAGSYCVNTIYFGGGTPSLLKPGQIQEILNKIRDVFSIFGEEIEITLEVNPGTVDQAKWKQYKRMGINRISMGLQSCDNAMLKKIGRIHTYEEFLENYKMARQCGIENISVDVMSALPGQTVEQFQKTLETVGELKPEHISSYSLIIEEGTLFEQWYGEDGHKKEELPSEEKEREMYELTGKVLGKYGYERYEISNYARAGFESKHNSSYWTGVPYLGIGLGASSYFQGERYENIRDLKSYIQCAENRELRICNVEKIGVREAMEEFMFLGLRRMCGVSENDFMKKFQIPLLKVYGKVVQKLEKQGLLKLEGDRLSLTSLGIDVSNYVFSEFLLDDECYEAIVNN